MSEPTLSDEILMAYADGELPEPEASSVRERAMRDPAIARRIAMFDASRIVLSEAFDPILDQRVPRRLVDAVKALGQNDDAQRGRAKRRSTRVSVALSRGWRQPAMAAAAACFLGIAAGWWLATRDLRPDDSGSLVRQVAALPGTLTEALDRLPSGERATARLENGAADLLPIASYQNGASVCREFELSRTSTEHAQAVRAVVCRSAGRWLLKAVADLSTGKARGDIYRPASGGDDLAPLLGLRASLSQQEERELIATGWRDR